jgi:hypothetical protein
MQSIERELAGSYDVVANNQETVLLVLHGNSYEAFLNALVDSQSRARIKQVTAHGEISIKHVAREELPSTVDLYLVAYDQDNAPTSTEYADFTAISDVGSILKASSFLCRANLKTSVLDVTNSEYWKIYEFSYSLKTPKNLKGIMRSDEHLDEPELNSMVIALIRGNTGHEFIIDDSFIGCGVERLRYQVTQQRPELAELT